VKKIILSILIVIGLISTVTGATKANMLDKETSLENTFAAGTLDFELGEILGKWNFPFIDIKPGESTGLQKLKLIISENSIQPNHLEIDIDTHNFSSGILNESTKNEFLKQIEVKQLYLEDINTNVVPNTFNSIELINLIDDTKDGNIGFKSLYDLEQTGVLDNTHILQKEVEFKIELALPEILPDINDNKYQDNSVQINFEFGMSQVTGQNILEN